MCNDLDIVLLRFSRLAAGLIVGEIVGLMVGLPVGEIVGLIVGLKEGLAVGTDVGDMPWVAAANAAITKNPQKSPCHILRHTVRCSTLCADCRASRGAVTKLGYACRTIHGTKLGLQDLHTKGMQLSVRQRRAHLHLFRPPDVVRSHARAV